MYAQALDAAARAVVVRDRGDWVALVAANGKLVEVGRSALAAPLVRQLRAQGYSVRFSFAWYRASRLEAANSAADARSAG